MFELELELLKLPQKQERGWLCFTMEAVTNQYEIKFILDDNNVFVEILQTGFLMIATTID